MNALTVIVKIKPGEMDALKQILEEIGEDIKGNPYLRVTESRKTHFMRWAIINDQDNGPRLLFISDYDGDLQSYLQEMIVIAPDLDKIWDKCEGYPGQKGFSNFIRTHSYKAQARYVGFPDETVESIRNYIAIRQQIEQFLDLEDVARFLDQAAIEGVFDRLSKLSRKRSWGKVLRAFAMTGWQAFLQRAHDALLGLFLRLAELFTHFGQAREFSRVTAECDDQKFQKSQIEVAVDTVPLDKVIVQNQMITYTTIKPRRLLLLRFALVVTNLLCKFGYPPGEFANVGTLHSFTWVIIDNGKHLLFLSNYDGSWQNYMGDFVNKLVWGLDGLYNNTEGYPKAGMKDNVAFTRFILEHQIPPQVFYSAYPRETVMNIIRDSRIGNTLGANFDPEAIERWLALL